MPHSAFRTGQHPLSSLTHTPVHCLLKLETTACDSCLGWSQLENLQDPDLFLGSLPWRAATTPPATLGSN